MNKYIILLLSLLSFSAFGVNVCYSVRLDDGSCGYAHYKIKKESKLVTGDVIYSLVGVVQCCSGGQNNAVPTGPWPVFGSGVVRNSKPSEIYFVHHRMEGVGQVNPADNFGTTNTQAWTSPWPAHVGDIAEWDEVGVFAENAGKVTPFSIVDYKIPSTVIPCDSLSW
jgi:hypothetical protein